MEFSGSRTIHLNDGVAPKQARAVRDLGQAKLGLCKRNQEEREAISRKRGLGRKVCEASSFPFIVKFNSPPGSRQLYFTSLWVFQTSLKFLNSIIS